MNQTAPQSSVPGPTGAGHLLPIISIGILVVIVAAGLGFLLLGHHTNAGSAGQAATSTINSQSTTSQQTTTTIPPIGSIGSGNSFQFINSGGGPGQSYMSENEMSGLLNKGGNGTYTAMYQSDPTNESGIYAGNVLAYWYAGYTIYGKTASGNSIVISEFVIKSPEAEYLYTAQSRTISGIINNTVLAANATSNGLTYTYLEMKNGNSSSAMLIGYKNEDLVDVVAPTEINRTKLAATVSGDIP